MTVSYSPYIIKFCWRDPYSTALHAIGLLGELCSLPQGSGGGGPAAAPAGRERGGVRPNPRAGHSLSSRKHVHIHKGCRWPSQDWLVRSGPSLEMGCQHVWNLPEADNLWVEDPASQRWFIRSDHRAPDSAPRRGGSEEAFPTPLPKRASTQGELLALRRWFMSDLVALSSWTVGMFD